jgi:signal transduction histidine kinase
VRSTRFRDLTTVLTALVLLALPTLAWLQARWLEDVSTMARERLDRAAQNAAAGVARDLEFELGRTMPWGSAPNTLDSPATSRGPVASDIFIVDAPGERLGQLRIREWIRSAHACAERAWPADLDSLRPIAERHYAARPRPRVVELAAGLDRVTSTHIIYGVPTAGGFESPPTFVPPCQTEPDAVLLVRVDLRAVRTSLLPMLIERHFGTAQTSEFNVVVVERDHPETVVAAGPGAFDPAQPAADPDVSAPLFVLRADQPGARDSRDPDGADGRGERRRDRTDQAGERWRAVDKAPWMLVARHRRGSLEAAVGRVYAWNLALAIGVLLLLACAVAAMAVSARRATRLSRQQVEFVAGVSHELRSPVAAIDLAAQNLGAGVVTDPARLRKYGEIIRTETRRLGATVERVLQFASINGGQLSLSREPVPVAALIDAVVARSRAEWPGASIEVSRGLPEDATVTGDRVSLESCLENLVSNAAKYAGPSAQVRVQTGADGGGKAPRVWVRVEDDGPGIAPEDRAHLFEPFHRGTQALERRIPGNGLGLYVVKHLVEAHLGSVEVDTARRSGAAFTLWLPWHRATEVPPADRAEERPAP